MSKSINEQITAMEIQLTELKEWKRRAQIYLRKASDFCEKKEEKLTAGQAASSPSDFEQKIKAFYGLKNADDEARFLSLMLNPQSKGYWTDHRG
ncbi:MAG: hypothetical protein K6E47_02465 [Lachnospiraceae bacterium]|nr:hypothetical protein [Lachnospiraceae bacterium]